MQNIINHKRVSLLVKIILAKAKIIAALNIGLSGDDRRFRSSVNLFLSEKTHRILIGEIKGKGKIYMIRGNETKGFVHAQKHLDDFKNSQYLMLMKVHDVIKNGALVEIKENGRIIREKIGVIKDSIVVIIGLQKKPYIVITAYDFGDKVWR